MIDSKMARNSRKRHLLVLVLPLLVLSATFTRAGDWPGWRGPSGLGYTDESNLPLTWNGKTGENILWKTPIAGGGPNADFTAPGHSSPIVWHGRVVITTAVFPRGMSNEQRRKAIADHHVICFSASDGRQLWDTLVPPGKCVVNDIYHGYAVPTPVTDGSHIFALFGSGVIAALDFDGKIAWREELPRLRDVDKGTCASPILYEDSVIIPSITETGLRALDKATGKLKWEQHHKEWNNDATAIIASVQGRPELIHCVGGLKAFNPATGEPIWQCRKASVSCASPAFGAGIAYADSGFGGRVGTAVDPTGKGEVSNTNVKWEIDVRCPAGSSPIIVGDYLYRITDNSKIGCWKVASGAPVYLEKAPKITPSSSPIACPDGRIYFASPKRSYVLKAGPRF
jgi:outer membrane protein assembly factor BamB